MRVLIIMGASLFNKSLRNQGWLRRPDIKISQVDGKTMRIRGMVRLPVSIGGTRSVHNFYITLNLCGDVILGEDCLYQHRAHIKFNPTILIINGMETQLRDTPDRSVVVVVDEDIKLPLEQQCQAKVN